MGLKETQELDLKNCYIELKKLGYNPTLDLETTQSNFRPLRFIFSGYYFNVFHTGKIQVYTRKQFDRKDFQKKFEELESLVIKKNIVDTKKLKVRR